MADEMPRDTVAGIKDLYQSADWKKEKHVPVIEAPDARGERGVALAARTRQRPHPLLELEQLVADLLHEHPPENVAEEADVGAKRRIGGRGSQVESLRRPGPRSPAPGWPRGRPPPPPPPALRRPRHQPAPSRPRRPRRPPPPEPRHP